MRMGCLFVIGIVFESVEVKKIALYKVIDAIY